MAFTHSANIYRASFYLEDYLSGIGHISVKKAICFYTTELAFSIIKKYIILDKHVTSMNSEILDEYVCICMHVCVYICFVTLLEVEIKRISGDKVEEGNRLSVLSCRNVSLGDLQCQQVIES